MEIPFEFCALRAFLQWERKEKGFHTRMKRNTSLEDIRAALKYFQVARNFRGLQQDSSAQWILDSLASVDSDGNLSKTEKVVELATRFKRKFGQFNLSAASKLLWLKHIREYIILDSRAIAALHKLGHRFGKRNYVEYCRAWRYEYVCHAKNIRTASAKLVKMRDFFPAWHTDSKAMSKLLSQPWFRERVFDIYLWEVGGDG